MIQVPQGLLGFSGCTRFCLLEPGTDAAFFWLQSLDDPNLAFVVTDPALFVPDYSVPVRPEQMVELKLGVAVAIGQAHRTGAVAARGPVRRQQAAQFLGVRAAVHR